jgi:hypothetical protein
MILGEVDVAQLLITFIELYQHVKAVVSELIARDHQCVYARILHHKVQQYVELIIL